EAILSGKDMVQELHRHSFFFVLALEKGGGEHSIDFTPYPVGDRTVFFTRPGQVHQLSIKNWSTGYLMAFSKSFYSPESQLFRKVSNRNFFQFEPDQFKRLKTLMNMIFLEHHEKRQRYQEAIASILDVFFIELLRQSGEPQPLSDGRGEYIQGRLEELLQ